MFIITQEGRININLKTGHSLDAYSFGMFVSDILDTRADLGKLHNMLLTLVLHGNVVFEASSSLGNMAQPFFMQCCKTEFTSTYTVQLCSFAVWIFLCFLYQSTFFSLLGDAGEKFGEKMQSLFLHESPQVN